LNHESSTYFIHMQKMGKMFCIFNGTGGAQPGDSGGPVVSNRNVILGFVNSGLGEANLIPDKVRNRQQRVSSSPSKPHTSDRGLNLLQSMIRDSSLAAMHCASALRKATPVRAPSQRRTPFLKVGHATSLTTPLESQPRCAKMRSRTRLLRSTLGPTRCLSCSQHWLHSGCNS